MRGNINKEGLITIFLFVTLLFSPFYYGCDKSGGINDIDNNDTTDIAEKSNLAKSKGNSIQIDPFALYSSGITPNELISDLKKANIKYVHYFVVNYWNGGKNDNLFKKEYLDALEENGIGVWLMLLGNCFYGKTTFPKEWEMEFLTPYPEEISFYSFHNEEYVNWQVMRVKTILRNYNFVGIEFAESYFPEWRTIYTNGFYGDVSLYARRKFTRQYLGLVDEEPLSFDAIRNDPEIYKKWQDFRSDAIVNFNQKIKEAIKSINPKTLFASWGMGIRNGSLEEIREHFGLDMERIVKEVKPDIFYIQTAAQDWGDPGLEPDYLLAYSYIVDALKKAAPDVPLGIQADIASLSFHNENVEKRDGNWWTTFMNTSLSNGYYTNTAYEYSFYKQQGLWVE